MVVSSRKTLADAEAIRRWGGLLHALHGAVYFDPVQQGSGSRSVIAPRSRRLTFRWLNDYMRRDLNNGQGQTYLPEDPGLVLVLHVWYFKHNDDPSFLTFRAHLVNAMKTNPCLKVMFERVPMTTWPLLAPGRSTRKDNRPFQRQL